MSLVRARTHETKDIIRRLKATAPSMTGQPVCSDISSGSAFGLREKKRRASPFRGFTAGGNEGQAGTHVGRLADKQAGMIGRQTGWWEAGEHAGLDMPHE